MSKFIANCFLALERLQAGTATTVPPGTKITKDVVAVEAGGKKQSIKTWESFKLLNEAIKNASDAQKAGPQKKKDDVQKLKVKNKELQLLLDESRAREVDLAYELFETKKKLAKLTGENVIPIMKKKSSASERSKETT